MKILLPLCCSVLLCPALVPTLVSAQEVATVPGIANYGEETADGYVLVAPADFRWPDGTVVENKTGMSNITKGMAGMDGQMEQEMEIVQTMTLTDANHVDMAMTTDIKRMEMVGADGTKQAIPAPPSPPVNLSFERAEGGEWMAKAPEGADEQAAMMASAMSQAAKPMVEAAQGDAGRVFLGESARKVGDSWELDMAALQQMAGQFGGAGQSAGMSINTEGMTGTVKFDRVEEREGEPCAVLIMDMDGVMKMEMGEQAAAAAPGAAGGMEMTMDLTATTWRSLERPVALLQETTGTVNTSVMGMKVDSEIKSTSTVNVTLP